MTPYSSIFSLNYVLSGPTTIYTTNGSHRIYFHSRVICVQHLVKNLSLNLLSVSQLCEFGLELHFSSKGCDVQEPQTS